MKASQIIDVLQRFVEEHGDCDVSLYSEESLLEDPPFNPDGLEDITDIRIVSDWPLPGKSLLYDEDASEPFTQLVMLYKWDALSAVHKK